MRLCGAEKCGILIPEERPLHEAAIRKHEKKEFSP